MIVDLYVKGKDGKVIVCTTDDAIVNLNYPMYTNNQCEWEALCSALHLIENEGLYWEIEEPDGFNVHIDSKLLISQLFGKVPKERIEVFDDCKSQRIKSKNLKNFYFKWNFLDNTIRQSTLVNYKYSDPLNNIARKWLK
jgi:ribonuclease HI